MIAAIPNVLIGDRAYDRDDLDEDLRGKGFKRGFTAYFGCFTAETIFELRCRNDEIMKKTENRKICTYHQNISHNRFSIFKVRVKLHKAKNILR